MRTKKFIFVTVVMILLVGVITADAASLSATAANQRWRVQTFDEDAPDVKNLSTTFVGERQIPLMSYEGLDEDVKTVITVAHLATEAAPGNCGQNDSWSCSMIEGSGYDIIPDSISKATSFYDVNHTYVGWAFADSDYGNISVVRREFTKDMEKLGTSRSALVKLDNFGDSLVGQPSLHLNGQQYQMAMTIRKKETLPYSYKLVYMYYTGILNNSCRSDIQLYYQCDVIDQSGLLDPISAPSLQVAKDGTIGIAYYKYSEGIKFAYPHTPTLLYPSNCGPGDNTWRCISIYNTGTIGSDVQLAFGQTYSEKGIVFTRDDTMIPNTLYVAEYVGIGGNCGGDKNYIGSNVNKWQCSELDSLAYNLNPSYSIAIDPEGYPVVAYDNALDDLVPIDLYITYPNGHVGLPGEDWIRQIIDRSPHLDVDIGNQAALSFNNSGLGFVAYRQNDGYYLTDPLKIAMQWFSTHLPIILR